MARRAKNRTIEAALERGRRLYLRHPTRGDRSDWCALWEQSQSFLEPWMPRPISEEAGRSGARFDRLILACDLAESQLHLICRRRDEQLVGMVNLNQIFLGSLQSCYLGYWIGERFVRNGYAGDGVRLVLRRAFRSLGLHRVEANIMPNNEASLRLARRIGFREEGYSPRYLKINGLWSDHCRFAMTIEDWRGAFGHPK